MLILINLLVLILLLELCVLLLIFIYVLKSIIVWKMYHAYLWVYQIPNHGTVFARF